MQGRHVRLAMLRKELPAQHLEGVKTREPRAALARVYIIRVPWFARRQCPSPLLSFFRPCHWTLLRASFVSWRSTGCSRCDPRRHRHDLRTAVTNRSITSFAETGDITASPPRQHHAMGRPDAASHRRRRLTSLCRYSLASSRLRVQQLAFSCPSRAYKLHKPPASLSARTRNYRPARASAAFVCSLNYIRHH